MKGENRMKRLSLFVGAIALVALLSALPVQAQLGASAGETPFSPDVSYPFCIQFDAFCDGFEVSAILADKMVVGTWQNYDCLGTDGPMLGGFTKGPPRRNYMMGDVGVFAPGDIFVFTLEVDQGTFDLWNHDAAGNLTQFLDNATYTFSPGACPFRPEGGLPASTAVE
jgi:hypothetical protein